MNISEFNKNYPNPELIPNFYAEECADVVMSNICMAHLQLFENTMGMNLHVFLKNPARLYIAMSKARPFSVDEIQFYDGGSYNWLDLFSGFWGVGSDMWPEKPFESEIVEYVRDICWEWLEFGCSSQLENNSIKLNCLHEYQSLLMAAYKYSRIKL